MWVKSHAGIDGNNIVDKLAQEKLYQIIAMTILIVEMLLMWEKMI